MGEIKILFFFQIKSLTIEDNRKSLKKNWREKKDKVYVVEEKHT